ncbi:MAG: sulfotransferase [Roseinatronobacter sp.]
MPLKFVICGMEHTGTTLVSDLFRQVDGVDAGFEVGVLLCDKPADFRDLAPFSRNILKGWGISPGDFDYCCSAPDHDAFYERLSKVSKILGADTSAIFDKTPRYIAHLDACMGHVDVPFIVTHKDPRAIIASDFKRAKVDDFTTWYKDYKRPKRRYMKTCYDQWSAARDNPRVISVGLEEMAMNARATLERMFAHVGLEFRLGYAVMDKLRYTNTRANFVSAAIAFEFMSQLSPAQQAMIEEDFSDMEAWYYG